MGQALYRKYRSRSWDEVVGQQHITATLDNAVKTGKIGHAYLFSGPRGVGKTSTARILARQINGLDYASDEPHIDIIEIDAASNTSVEDIRDLREKVSVAPALAKYKIYIIDEVHMLSKSAFNALLKTLEEPPAHVIFILATTDPQKLPETIISRTQHFAFQPSTPELAAKHLKAIAKSEKLKLDDSAAELIAELGEGSFRDSISLLDQLAASGQPITRQLVESLAGLPPETLITQLAGAIENHKPKELVQLLESARASGYQASPVASRLSRYFRQHALETASSDSLALAKQLLAVPASHKPDQLLEIVLLEAALAGTPPLKPSQASNPTTSPKPVQRDANQAKTLPEKDTKLPANKSPENRKRHTNASELWASVLEQIRPKYHTLYAMARMASPSLADDNLLLEFPYPFHLRRVDEAKNKQIVASVASELSGRTVTVSCRLNPELASDEPTFAANSEPTVDPPMIAPVDKVEEKSELESISNVFGGAELLE